MNNKMPDTVLIEKRSFFWSPDYLDVSAWIEHVPFAFWIVETFEPKVVVELGVHNGTSYFAFCQAVKTLNLSATCYGVDTWKGDEHAGFYEEETYNKVTSYNTNNYSRFSTLIRSTFDEAIEYFIDGTINLLHIDGLHTYEAVKHDFTNWLPKLAPDAIVIFHDINVRERNFGVFKLWEELKQQYKHFQFDFGHGLGILAVGHIVEEELKILFNGESPAYHIFLRNLFSDRGSFFKKGLHFEQTLKSDAERAATQQAAYAQLTENFKAIELQNSKHHSDLGNLAENYEQLTENFKGLELHNIRLEENNRLLSINYEQLTENFKGLELHNYRIEENNRLLSINYEQLTENFKGLELHNYKVEESNKQLITSNDQLNEKNRILEVNSTKLIENNKAILIKNEELNENNKVIESAITELRNHYQFERKQYESEVMKLTEKISIADASKEKMNDELSALNEAIKNLKAKIFNQERDLQWYQATYEDRSLLGTLKEKLISGNKKKI